MLDDTMMDEVEALMRQAASLASSGALARKRGDEAVAEVYFRKAYRLAVNAASRTAEGAPHPAGLDILRAAVLLALDCWRSISSMACMGGSPPTRRQARSSPIGNSERQCIRISHKQRHFKFRFQDSIEQRNNQEMVDGTGSRCLKSTNCQRHE